MRDFVVVASLSDCIMRFPLAEKLVECLSCVDLLVDASWISASVACASKDDCICKLFFCVS